MIKQNLGKLIFLVVFSINLFATGVSVRVSSPAIYKGDSVNFTIEAIGDKVVFPDINTISGYKIIGVSSGSSMSIINGNYSKKLTKTYSFIPKKSVTIPSFVVKIDGKEYKTDIKKVDVIKPSASKAGDDFVVELKVDKTNLRVGESTKLKVVFKQKLNARADKLIVNEPNIPNFWVKKVRDSKQYTQGEYVVQEFSYIIFAQKEGEFTIEPIEANIGKATRRAIDSFFNDPFFNSMPTSLRWKHIYSNSLKLKVTKLPQSLELYGDFKISTKVDKTVVNSGKPVNLTITIDGEGNIDDIKKFDISLQDVVVYADKPQLNTHLVKENYSGSFIQKIVFIANKDFTIPSVSLTYFDKVTKKVKTIQTKPIDIKVVGGSKTVEKPQIQTLVTNPQQTQEKTNTTLSSSKDDSSKYMYFVLGLILGSVLTYIFTKKPKLKKGGKSDDMVTMIKNTKDDKKLFDLLLPYAKEHKDIEDILHLLEENIYKKAGHKIDKQKLYDIFL